LSAGAVAALAAVALVAGIGIAALGPGGVLVTIGLFVFTSLSPAEVAGTAILTHVGTGLLGTSVYVKSGQLRQPLTRRTATILAAGAVVGAPVGVLINSAISRGTFSVLLGIAVGTIGVVVWVRERRRGIAVGQPSEDRHPELHVALVAVLGFGVAVAGGLFGIGGPLLSVPLLVVVGVPVLAALGAAQAQSVVIATVGTLGYLVQGAISWPLALLVGVPELVGVMIGWRIAHRVPARALTLTLAMILVALAPYLALR
jgi:uncharacterized protein